MAHTVRIPNVYGSEATAVASPYQVFRQVWTTPSTSENFDTDGTTFVAVSRDPLNAMMRLQRNTEEWNYELNYYGLPVNVRPGYPYGNSNAAVEVKRWCPMPRGPWSGDPGPFALAVIPSFSDTAYGSVAYTRYENRQGGEPGSRWFWLDAGTSGAEFTPARLNLNTIMYCNFVDDASGAIMAASGSENLGSIMLVALDSETEPIQYGIHSASNGWVPDSGGQHIVSSGFYRIEVELTATWGSRVATAAPLNAVSLYVRFKGRADTIRTDAIPGLVARAQEFHSMRIIGAAAMISPDGQAFGAGGICQGIQFPEDTLPHAYIPNGLNRSAKLFETLTGVPKTTTFEGNKGIYGFVALTGRHDLDMQTPFKHTVSSKQATGLDPTNNGPNLCGTFSKMFPPGGWVLLTLRAPPTTMTATSPFPFGTARLTFSFSLELETLSTWYATAIAPCGVDVDAIAHVMRGMPQYTENPFHWADITNWIGRNYKIIAKVGLSALGIMFPEASPAAAAASGAVDLIPGSRSSVATTDALVMPRKYVPGPRRSQPLIGANLD